MDGHSDRLSFARVYVINNGVERLCGILRSMLNVENKVVKCDGLKGSVVKIKILGSKKILSICEVEVFGQSAQEGWCTVFNLFLSSFDLKFLINC